MNILKKYRSAVMDWFSGFGAVFNIFGGYYNVKIQSDEEAMRSDWEQVGKDIWKNVK